MTARELCALIYTGLWIPTTKKTGVNAVAWFCIKWRSATWWTMWNFCARQTSALVSLILHPPSCRWLPNPVHSAGGQWNSRLSDTANCVYISHRSWPSRPLTSSVCLPDFVQKLYNLLIQDKDDGNIQTHPAKSRNRALVEPAAQRKLGYEAAMVNG